MGLVGDERRREGCQRKQQAEALTSSKRMNTSTSAAVECGGYRPREIVCQAQCLTTGGGTLANGMLAAVLAQAAT